MPKKDKLSKEERSQIAKDRWAKIRKAKAAQEDISKLEPELSSLPPDERIKALKAEEAAIREDLAVDPDTLKSGRDENGVPSIVGLGDGAITPNGAFIPNQSDIVLSTSGVYRQNPDGSFTEIGKGIDTGQGLSPSAPIAPAPAPQLALVKAPKPKRYQGPKEFSVALKAAENRLAKAITERSDIGKELAILQAKQWYLEKTEIPSLMGIINALKGSGNYAPPTPFDFSGGVPNAQAFQAPIDPQAALMAAMAAPPVSRASGGAVQFSPDVVGSLEGPDDDDPDRFITGPHAGGGWIGA